MLKGTNWFFITVRMSSLILVSATKYETGGHTQNLVELFLFCFNAFNIEGYNIEIEICLCSLLGFAYLHFV
jgi:hypothetical protein